MTDEPTVRIALAGGGAFGVKHAAALRRIDGVEVTAVVSSTLESAREFVAAIREGREPNASIAQVMPCYRTPAALEEQLAAASKS